NYRKALALLPAPSADEMRMLRDTLATPLTPKLLRLLRTSEPALEELRQGATRPLCDWQLDSPKRLEAMVDLVGAINQLGQLAVLQARWAFQQRAGADGFDDLADLL